MKDLQFSARNLQILRCIVLAVDELHGDPVRKADHETVANLTCQWGQRYGIQPQEVYALLAERLGHVCWICTSKGDELASPDLGRGYTGGVLSSDS